MSNATNNGAQRKQLSDQLDRLDRILDGLSEALNESVADAVKSAISLAVTEAVHAAVREVLSSPELLRAALEKHAPAMTPPAPQPQPTSLKQNVAGITSKLREKLKNAATVVKQKLRGVFAVMIETGKKAGKIAVTMPTIIKAVARAAWAMRKPCVIALGVGVLFGAACYLGGQLFSSVANGLGAAALALPMRRLFWGGSRNA